MLEGFIKYRVDFPIGKGTKVPKTMHFQWVVGSLLSLTLTQISSVAVSHFNRSKTTLATILTELIAVIIDIIALTLVAMSMSNDVFTFC